MNQDIQLTNKRLTTPPAAAIAGIIFSGLMLASLFLLRTSVPADLQSAEAALQGHENTIQLALNMLPFSGIAFLWFIGVVRDRIGNAEDRFFASVFLGSGLLFLAMMFASAAIAGGVINLISAFPGEQVNTNVYVFGRALSYEITNVYAMKMAGVFMISTCTLSLRTKILPRWMIIVGYVLALFLLFSLGFFYWAPVVFPLWVLLISLYILSENLRRTTSIE